MPSSCRSKRAIVALVGAGVMIVTGMLEQKEGIKDVDWNTLGLLTAMMILVSVSRRSGMFEFVAVWSARAAKAHPARIMLLPQIATAVLSTFLYTVATMITLIKNMAPAFGGPDHIQPLWWCLSLGVCLGGNDTLIGASANLTVAGISGRNNAPFKFIACTLYAFPILVVSVAICHLYVW